MTQYLYKRSPSLAALEGDTRELCRRLRNSAVTPTMAERRCAADLIEGKVKRRASVLTRIRDIDVARYVVERERIVGSTDAIQEACEVFDCERTTVTNALTKHRGRVESK